MDPNTYDVIVIGLGVSGLTALTTLAKNGRHVLGIEAQNRLGGRIHTRSANGGIVELGAEWIHGTVDSLVYDTAIANNVTVLPQDLTFGAYRSDGSLCNVTVVNELLEYCVGLIENPPQEPEPLGQFVVREFNEYISKNRPELLKDEDFLTEFKEMMNLLTNNYEASNDWSDVSTNSRYTELDGHQHTSWHRYGYKTLIDILLNTYNNGPGLPHVTTKLNTEVSNIIWSDNPSDLVTVVTKNGDRFNATSVIVTVSLGVLKDRHKTLFTPPLPPKKVEAIDKISMGVMDKVILYFDEAWWPKETSFFSFIWRGEDKKKVEAEDYWLTRIFGASRPMGCEKALTLWTSGDVGKLVETLPEQTVKSKCMELLRKFMGKNVSIPDPIDMVRSTWYTNPYTKGSYTFDNVNSPNYPDARQNLAAPLLDTKLKPRVLFAGEATNDFHFSTVHGAMETGLREAQRLLNFGKSKL